LSSEIWLYNTNTMLKLTSDQARAFILTRQYLSQPALAPADVVRRLIALQAQYSAAVPVAVWTRCPQVERDWVESSWLNSRQLVKTWMLRSTLHVIAAQDLPLLVQAFGKIYEAEYVRFIERRRGIAQDGYEQANAAILEALSSGPLTRSALHSAVPQLERIGAAEWGVDVKGLAFQGQIVVAGRQGVEPVFARRKDWLEGLEWSEERPEQEAQQSVLRRYLEAFAPAAPRDFAHWAGITTRLAQSIFATLEDELRMIEVEGWKGSQYILAKHEAELRQADMLPPVMVLPKFDALLVGYARPPRFVRHEDYKQVYGASGQIEAIVLVDGEAAATWRIEQNGKQLQFKLKPLSLDLENALDAVQTAFEGLGAFLDSEKISVRVV
jgi:hypothetical protein